MTVLSPRPSKAQARWNLLRQAILSSAGSSPASSSLPPHTGGIRTYTFHLPCPSTSSPLPLTIALQLITPSSPSTLSSACPLSSPLAALVSHRPENVGVDNTGNVRVWPAEEALLLLLLKKGMELNGYCMARLTCIPRAKQRTRPQESHLLPSPSPKAWTDRLASGGGQGAFLNWARAARVCSVWG